MTLTAWEKAIRAVNTKGSAVFDDGCELIKYAGLYGSEYSLKSPDRNTIICTWNLDSIKEICVD